MKIKINITKMLFALTLFPVILGAEGLGKGGVYDPSGTGGTLKLQPKVRIVNEDKIQKRIPIEVIRPYLVGAEILEPNELETAPYIFAPEGEHLVSSTGGTIYARGFGYEPSEGQQYGVFRKGDTYLDPDTGEVLGIEAMSIGKSQVTQGGDPTSLALITVTREVLIGDRLLPQNNLPVMDFFPSPPTLMINTKIISVYDGVTQIGQYNVVVLRGGVDMGLAVGNVLNVYQAGAKVVDQYAPKKETVTLPDVYAGEMMVFKVFNKVSLALVLEAVRPMHVLDKVKTL